MAQSRKSRKGHGRNSKYDAKETKDNKKYPNCSDGDYGSKYDNKRNDPAWYNKFPELVSVATNVSWNVAYGSPITFNVENNGRNYVDFEPTREIGVAAYKFIPTFGVGDKLTDPINKCALEMYSQLRFNKSGNVGYDPADILQMLQAMDSVYMFIAMGKRLYGALNIASSVNRYIPRILVSAMGFNFDDILTHKADLLFFLNTLIVQAAKINVPIGMTVTARHEFLCSNVFRDDTLARNSMFMYIPEVFWKYDAANAELVSVPNDVGTFDDFVSLGWELLNAVETVEDFYTMNANILAAYDYDNLFRIAGIDPTYSLIPEYRAEMLIQQHNSTFMGNKYYDQDGNHTMHITQNMTEGDPNLGAIEFLPEFETWPSALYDQLLDIPYEQPSTDDIMESTRFRVAGIAGRSEPTNPNLVSVVVTASGTEILTTCAGFTFARNVYGKWTPLEIQLVDDSGDTNTTNYAAYFTKLNMAPVVFYFGSVEIDGQSRMAPLRIFGDLTNYAVVNRDNLSNMHQAALLSQLAVSRSNLR